MTLPAGLKRYPAIPKDLLQAWDAADELALEHLNAHPELCQGKILLHGDAFGALATALKDLGPVSVVDSFVAKRAAELNSTEAVKPVAGFADVRGPFDLALVRLPKSLSAFEDTMAHVSGLLRPGGALIVAYRVKHELRAGFPLIAKYVGETQTSLAKKKARLIFARQERAAQPSPYPSEVRLDGFDGPFWHPAQLFSREKLDVGTRFLLESLVDQPPEGAFSQIVDLGCANGIVGIAALRAWPKAEVLFTDDSWMAVESARENHRRHAPQTRARFGWQHSLEGEAPGSADLILCNPPFHQGTTLGDFVARQMFRDAKRVLRPGGAIRVVGNTHLRYPSLLRQSFSDIRIVARSKKFEIADALAGA